MKARDVEKCFGMPRRLRYVEDFYASRFDGTYAVDRRFKRDMLWGMGFKLQPGDIVCGIILRPGRKPKRKK